MKKYRIIKITTYDWEKIEKHKDGCFNVYRDKQTAEEVLQKYMWKNKKEIVWYY